MKKLLGFVVLGLLVCTSINASSIWDHLHIGMTKKEFYKKVQGFGGEGKQVKMYFETKEIQKINKLIRPKYDGMGHIFKANSFRRYFKDIKTEVITHSIVTIESAWKHKTNWDLPENFVWYVFENVTKPMNCKNTIFNFCRGTIGNGKLKAVVFNKKEALAIASPKYAEIWEEEKKAAEEKRIAEEKAKAEEYERLEAKHENSCKDFSKETSQYKTCIYDAEKEEQKKIALEKKLNEIDPNLIPIGSGSGFFVSRDGYVVTNAHVSSICELIEIKIAGTKHYLNVVENDLVNDLGLLKGNYIHPNILELDIEGPNLGEDILAVGYPLGGFTGEGVKITRGVVSSLSGPGNNFSEFQHDAATAPGSSGGPILNKSGQIVGVVYAGIDKIKVLIETDQIPEGMNFAISSQILTNFLKGNKVEYVKSSMNNKLETEEVAKIGDSATVKLVCLNTKEFYEKIKKSKTHKDIIFDLK